MRVLDCRGLACPQPVIEARKALGAGPDEPLAVRVDNATARDNLMVMAAGLGREASWEADGEGFTVAFPAPGKGAGKVSAGLPAAASGGALREPGGGALVVVLASDRLGQGEEELGRVLMKSFLHTLKETEPPATLACLNRGVYLACAGSPVLETLQALAAQGTEILSCGTCLDYYQLKADLAVGSVSNMYTILERMAAAGRLIQW